MTPITRATIVDDFELAQLEKAIAKHRLSVALHEAMRVEPEPEPELPPINWPEAIFKAAVFLAMLTIVFASALVAGGLIVGVWR